MRVSEWHFIRYNAETKILGENGARKMLIISLLFCNRSIKETRGGERIMGLCSSSVRGQKVRNKKRETERPRGYVKNAFPFLPSHRFIVPTLFRRVPLQFGQFRFFCHYNLKPNLNYELGYFAS